MDHHARSGTSRVELQLVDKVLHEVVVLPDGPSLCFEHSCDHGCLQRCGHSNSECDVEITPTRSIVKGWLAEPPPPRTPSSGCWRCVRNGRHGNSPSSS